MADSDLLQSGAEPSRSDTPERDLILSALAGDESVRQLFLSMERDPAGFRRDSKLLLALAEAPQALLAYISLYSPSHEQAAQKTVGRIPVPDVSKGIKPDRAVLPPGPGRTGLSEAAEGRAEELNRHAAAVDDPKYARPPSPRSVAEICTELGHAYLRLDRYPEAEQAFQTAVGEDGGSAVLRLYLADVLEHRESIEEALRTVLAAVPAAPTAAATLLVRAFALFAHLVKSGSTMSGWLETQWAPQVFGPAAAETLDAEEVFAARQLLGLAALYCGDAEQAIKHFAAALERHPQDLFTMEWLGEAHCRAGRLEDAYSTFSTAFEQADAAEQRVIEARMLLELGRVSLMRGDYQGALTNIEKSLRLGSPLPRHYLILGQAYLKMDRPEDARQAAGQALALDTQNSDGLVLQAAAMEALGDHAGAAQAAGAALALDPGHLDAMYVGAQALAAEDAAGAEREGTEAHAEAVRLLREYVAARPGDTRAERLFFNLLREQRRPATELLDALERAAAHVPAADRHAFLLDLADTALTQQSLDERKVDVLATLAEVERQAPDYQTARKWRLRGAAQDELGHADEALDSYARGLTDAPEDTELLELYARLLAKQGRQAEALEPWQRLAALEPYRADLQLYVAVSYDARGESEAALQAVNKASEGIWSGEEKIKAALLKCELVEKLGRPASERAEAYLEAGKQYYWNDNQSEAAKCLRKANDLDLEKIEVYWYLADALVVSSYSPDPPYVDAKRVDDSLAVWEEGFRRAGEKVEGEFAWIYLTRALISDRRALLASCDSRTELWTAAAFTERRLLSDRSGDNAIAWAALSRYHRSLSNESVSLNASQKAIETRPDARAAIEERSVICANTGELEEALRLIEGRGELATNDWLSGVKAFVLLYLGRLSEAAELINGVVRVLPDQLWSLDLRAEIYRRHGDPVTSLDQYAEVWKRRQDPRYANPENLSVFANAAYYLGILPDPVVPAKIEEAVEIYEHLTDKWMRLESNSSLGMCQLVLGKLEEGERSVLKGIRAAANKRVVNNAQYDIEELRRWSAKLAHQSQLLPILDRLGIAAQARLAEIDPLPTAEQQLAQLANEQDITGGWATTAIHAGLARLYVEQERWQEAVLVYERLLAAPVGFPEARIPLNTYVERQLRQCDELLQKDQFSEAAEKLAPTFALAHLRDEPLQRSAILSRLALACCGEGDAEAFHRHLEGALAAYRDGGGARPGEALGQTLAGRVTAPGLLYWRLDDTLQGLAQTPGIDAGLRDDLTQVQDALRAYLDGFYQLAGDAAKDLDSIVQPIGFDIGYTLVPEDTSTTGWSLFTTYIPQMRERITKATGIPLPGVRARGNTSLPRGVYLIDLDEVVVTSGEVPVNKGYCLAPAAQLQALGIPAAALQPCPGPRAGQAGFWIASEHWPVITEHGLELWSDPIMYIVRHLEAVILRNLAGFMGVDQAETLLDTWAQDPLCRDILKDVFADPDARLRLARVLRELARESVPLTDAPRILHAAQDVGVTGGPLHEAVAAIRLRLREYLPGNRLGARRVSLPETWEGRLVTALAGAPGDEAIVLSPADVNTLFSEMRGWPELNEPGTVLVTHDLTLRRPLRRLIAAEFPDLMIHGRDELLPEGGASDSTVATAAQSNGGKRHAQ